MTDFLGQSQVIPYLAGLSKKGFLISIISAEKKENFINNKNNISNILNNAGISWYYIKYSKTPPIISTVWNIYKIKILAKKLQKRNKFDIVHCRSYIAAFIGEYLKRKFNIKFIFDMRGFWADERVEGGLWNINNIIYKKTYNFFKKKEISFIKSANSTISLTEEGKKTIHNWKTFENHKPTIDVIPCCADLKLFNPENIISGKLEKIKNILNISKDDFIISYLGSIGTWYMLDEMLLFFKRLLITKKNAKFLFISGENHEYIYKSAKKNNISTENILIYKAERQEVPILLSLSKISMFFIKPVFSKKASSPTKLAEILGMGIPIVCNANVGDINEIFSKEKIGELIYSFNIEEYDRIINNIEEIIKYDKNKIISLAKQYFSLKNGMEKYFEVYQNTLK